MYITNPSTHQASTHKKDEQNQHGYSLRYQDTNANLMQGSRLPSMGTVSSQNQTIAENVQFLTSSEHRKEFLQEGVSQESSSEKAQERQLDEDDRVQRLWAPDLRRAYNTPSSERVVDSGQLSPQVSNGRNSGSRRMSPVEGIPPRTFSPPPSAMYDKNASRLTSHSVLQYTSPPMVHYSTVPGLQAYAPYYSPFVRLPGHPPVMRPAPHEESSYSEMLANIGSHVREGQPLPHSLLPTTVSPFGTIDGSPLPSPREYQAPGFIPGSGIYVVGVQPDSRSSSRHPSGDQRQADKDLEHTHPHPARERWESHERKFYEHQEEERSSRGPSPRDLQLAGHVRFKEPPYHMDVGPERAVYQESPKIAHVHPQPVPREERYIHQVPSANIQTLYANALTIQTSLHSPPQLVSPPVTYSNMQLQLSPTPHVRPSTHATLAQKAQPDAVVESSNSSRMKDSLIRKESPHGTDPVQLTYHQTPLRKLNTEAEYPGSSTFPSYFTRGSVIQLASGELKRVEDLCTEDFIQSAQVTDGLRIDSSTVVRIKDVVKKSMAIISFSVGNQREQVTVEAGLEHPFYVFGHGWSSVNPELTSLRYNLACHKLAVGDVCVSLTPKESVKHRKEEQSDAVQRTYRSDYLDNKRQRVQHWKNPPDNIEHHKDQISMDEQRHHTDTDNPVDHRYLSSGVDKPNKLASELKSLNVSSSGATRNSTQGVRASNIPSRSEVKSGVMKGKHSYQTLEEVKEEDEEMAEVNKQKTSRQNIIHEPVDHIAKFTIAR
ncbi:uncharacterized protein [Antedon mediterranea]|uniref:uncharacterized protein n=1 Tax=Antedon mediterranea TaxID=105859 RepID=UPI003AF7C09E